MEPRGERAKSTQKGATEPSPCEATGLTITLLRHIAKHVESTPQLDVTSSFHTNSDIRMNS